MSNVEGWTDARFFSFIRSALRRAWTHFPNKYKVLANAKRRKKNTTGKQKYEYQCAACRKWFSGKSVQVDHISPAGTLRSYDDLPSFVSKLFCDIDGLQVLCTACHSGKTMKERGIRPEMASFKKLKAANQKAYLREHNLPEGANVKERVAIYEDYLGK